jgi:hypothetical protein
MKYCLIQMKEHGMITIEKRYYLIKIKWLNKMLKCIVLDLISGHIFHLLVLKDFKIMKVDFIKSTEIFSKK